jgi:PKD repeat protein
MAGASVHASVRGPAWWRLSCVLACSAALFAPGVVHAQGTSTQANPTYTFSTPGVKQVKLTVCNMSGQQCSTKTKTVTVLDPKPAVVSTSVSPSGAETGQMVRLTGSATGQPPLSLSWRVTLAGIPILELPGSTIWWDTRGLLPGLYSLTFQAQNASGAASAGVPVTLGADQAADFYTVAPCRVYDSRIATPLTSGADPRTFSVTNACEIPANARAVVANVTAVTPSGTGHVTVFPGNYPAPATSSINFNAGTTRANHSILQLATDGTGTLAATASLAGGGSVHLLVDVTGYFAAPAS